MKERRKVMTGHVVSDKMTKTVIVAVEERRSHPLYGKVVTRVRRFKAHNEEPQAKLGDLVKITEARPLSHEKRFRVSEIIQRGQVVEAIVEKELESLREKEEADRQTRRVEEERRASARLRELAGQEEEEESSDTEASEAEPAEAAPSEAAPSEDAENSEEAK